MRIKDSAKTVAVGGILSAVAIVLSYLESLIPPLAFLPVGAKLGLSNISLLFSAQTFGFPVTLAICIIKSGFVFLVRGASAGFISLCGGLIATIIMVLLSKIADKKDISVIGISVVAAVGHNFGQYIAASVLAGSNLFIAYAPALIIYGVIFGIITGIIAKVIIPKIKPLVK